MIDSLRSFCLVKLRGSIRLASLDLVLVMVTTVSTVVPVRLTGTLNTGCPGQTRFVLHIPTSS